MTLFPPVPPGDLTTPKPYRIVPRFWMAFVVPLLVAILFIVVVPIISFPLATQWPGAGPVGVIIAAAVVVVPLFGFFRWLRPVFFEQRVGSPVLVTLALAPFLVYFVAGFFAGAIRPAPAGIFVLVVLSALQAAINEELTYRGSIVFLARTRAREIWIAVISSVAFGLFHLVNLAGVQSADDVPVVIDQVVYATLVGMTFYAMRRVTGTLLVPMVFHFVNNALPAVIPDDNSPVFFAIGNKDYSLLVLLFYAVLITGTVVAVVLALKHPRVPVVFRVEEPRS